MKREDVESSVIGAVGYSRVLEIQFESGRVYQYYDVPQDVFEGMLNAESKGRYFNAHIRGKFDYQEIELISRANQRVKLDDAVGPGA
jgi:hypothetical protein